MQEEILTYPTKESGSKDNTCDIYAVGSNLG